MLAEERLSRIMKLLSQQRTATVQELCEALDASESTIRRDLNELDRMGKVNKVHGGATLPDSQFLADEPTMAAKEALAVVQKKCIAKAAAALITAEDFVFLDAGSTTLALAAAPVFAGRIAVTRSAEVEALCRAGGFPVLRHAEPRRSDTVRLGLTALLAQQPDLQGCVFLPGDQPCLTRQTLEALAIGAAPDTIRRTASPDGTPGSPVLFGRDYFAALLHLPEGCGGSAVLRAHPQAIRLLPTPAAELRDIDTRSDLEALRGGKG